MSRLLTYFLLASDVAGVLSAPPFCHPCRDQPIAIEPMPADFLDGAIPEIESGNGKRQSRCRADRDALRRREPTAGSKNRIGKMQLDPVLCTIVRSTWCPDEALRL